MKRWLLVAGLVPGVAFGQVSFSTAPHPPPPPGYGAGMEHYGDSIAKGYAAVACGLRPEQWAQILTQRLSDSVLTQLKTLKKNEDQTTAVLDYFGEEIAFGQGFNSLGCTVLLQQGFGPLDAIEAGIFPP